MSEISDPVKKWKATQAKLEAAQMEDAAPAADSDSDEDLDEVRLLLVKNITDFDRRWHIQLDKYETAPNFNQISQNLTSDCLLI